ncbi:MAG: septation ring formation regulator EzrA [Betaproteobacteria bacterium]|jgi:cell division protein FtsB|nr:septum formation initiator family protein [Burkholderiaceae bacterium]NBO00900.1 septation ring formation regulator EzrA [Betaproteobacteria bacterium]NBO89045.1 septation ring formation regulator EzrA [Betaproteobacteria bacterium]NBU44569.1 septation ring formation regulator EzrA [Betaproteobacteria bacterium]NCW39615.1 septation ring formation regulator EzrA [Betaproteobacteria bacterium]
MSRSLTWILLGLLLVLQSQLWIGRGSVPDVMRQQQLLAQQRQENQQAQVANQRLMAELRDLREGKEMIEERARREVGMVKSNEIFVQLSR